MNRMRVLPLICTLAVPPMSKDSPSRKGLAPSDQPSLCSPDVIEIDMLPSFRQLAVPRRRVSKAFPKERLAHANERGNERVGWVAGIFWLSAAWWRAAMPATIAAKTPYLRPRVAGGRGWSLLEAPAAGAGHVVLAGPRVDGAVGAHREGLPAVGLGTLLVLVLVDDDICRGLERVVLERLDVLGLDLPGCRSDLGVIGQVALAVTAREVLLQESVDLVAVHLLALEKQLGEGLDGFLVVAHESPNQGHLALQHAVDLGDRHGAAADGHGRDQHVIHAVDHDHLSGSHCRRRQVTGEAAHRLAEDLNLDRPGGERHPDVVDKLLASDGVPLVLEGRGDKPQRPIAADDRRVLHLHVLAEERAYDRVTALVVGHAPVLVPGHGTQRLLDAERLRAPRSLDVGHGDRIASCPSSLGHCLVGADDLDAGRRPAAATQGQLAHVAANQVGLLLAEPPFAQGPGVNLRRAGDLGEVHL